MSINSNNIDKWLFDYYEGNLSPSDVRKLEQFLKKNPEYYEDAEAWKDSFVEESVPAFNASFMLKETETSGSRRKIAYAALLLLLLLGSASVYYLVSTNGEGQQKMTGGTSTPTPFSFKYNVPVTHADDNSNNNPGEMPADRTIENSSNTASNHVQHNAPQLSFVPAQVPRVSTLQPTNIYVYNYNVVSPEVNAGQENNTNPAVQNNQALATSTTVNPDQIVNTTETGTSAQETTVDKEQTNRNAEGTNVVNTTGFTHDNTTAVVPAGIDQSLTEVHIEQLNSLVTEDINLTTGSIMSGAEKENKLVEAEAKTNNTQENINSGMGPDELMANAKKEENKNSEIINTEKKNIPTSGKGISFTNRRQITLLQNINNEFENNASFITQQYGVDGFIGVRMTKTRNNQHGAGQIGGLSQYFRKIKTTVNIWGHNDKTDYINNAGAALQVATSFKIDRFQSIVPSVTLSMDQYSFDHDIFRGNTGQETAIPSYGAGLLTGNDELNKYNNATKMNMNAGVLYHHKKFYASVAVNGIMQPKFTYELNDRTGSAKNQASMNMVIGTDFVSKKRPEFSLSPQFAIMVRNMDASFGGGAVLRYQNWSTGAGISSTGALNAYAGFSHRSFSLQYRFMYDQMDSPFKGVSGHYVTTHFNLKSLVKKQKPILDSEK